MEKFELPPSRLIGDIKRALEAAVDAGEIEARLESEAYVEFVAQNKQRFGLE
jgi:poly(A) polymerase